MHRAGDEGVSNQQPPAASERDPLIDEEARLAEDALEAEATGDDLGQVEERLEILDAEEDLVEALAQGEIAQEGSGGIEAEEEFEEVESPEELEPALDEIIRLRTEAELDDELRAEMGERESQLPAPPGADEFVCRSCFLAKRRTQLANPQLMWCRDCANDPGTRERHTTAPNGASTTR